MIQSRFEEAIGECEKAVRLSQGGSYELGDLGYAYAVAGRKAEALKVLDQLNELSKRRFVPAYTRALIYTGLGEKDRAIEWLEKAYEERSSLIIYPNLKVDPVFDSLRSDPRFQDLLRRMGL